MKHFMESSRFSQANASWFIKFIYLCKFLIRNYSRIILNRYEGVIPGTFVESCPTSGSKT